MFASFRDTFYDTIHWTPFSPGNLILDELAEPMTLKTMQELVGADCRGLYIRGANGQIKETLYNATDIEPHSPEYEAQHPYRASVMEDINVAMDEVGVGETLVLIMLCEEMSWSVEAMRGEDGKVTFALKHAPGYERACYRAGCDDRGAYEYAIQGTDGKQILLVDQEFIRVNGDIDPLSWSTLPEQTLRIYNADGSAVFLNAVPIKGLAPDTPYDDSYRFWADEYVLTESDERLFRSAIDMTAQQWRKLLRWLSVHARRIPVE
jgi:hypothetical protein